MRRSALYVPADRPDRVAKALVAGADAVIVDLEDAIPVAGKDAARDSLAALLADLGPPTCEVWVRVNTGDRGLDDTRAVAVPGLTGVCLARAEDPAYVEAVGSVASGLQLEPLVETGLALRRLDALAQVPGVVRLQTGEADLAADLGLPDGSHDAGLAVARGEIVAVSAAYGLDRPMAAVSPDVRDLDRFRESTVRLAALGFFGRVCIHPGQVAVANEVFTPTAGERDAARRLLASFDQHAADGLGVFVDEQGRMIDEAMVRRARWLVALPGDTDQQEE